MSRWMRSQKRRAVEAEWAEVALLAFSEKVRYDPMDGAWWSRHPLTLQWQKDRAWGRRFRLLADMALHALDNSELTKVETEFLTFLLSRQGQYLFLSDLAALVTQRAYEAKHPRPAEPTASKPAVPPQRGAGHVAEFMTQVPRGSLPRWVKASVLFSQYQQWCEERGVPALSQRSFGQAVQAHGYQRKRSNGYWYAIGAAQEQKSDEPIDQ